MKTVADFVVMWASILFLPLPWALLPLAIFAAIHILEAPPQEE